jgi:uncharacterized protein YlxW (UPF0749 family)
MAMTMRLRHLLTVATVAALAGLMFTINAQLARDTSGEREPTALADLVAAAQERVDQLTTQVDALTAEVDALSSQAPPIAAEDPALVLREAIASGTVPVTGDGLRVALDDAPESSRAISWVTPDDLVVHQQDLQEVINALWAGGAEAMTLQGERVTMTTAFRCSGNTLLLHGRVFSPPYIVEAVGDPDSLQAALKSSAGVSIYQEWVAAVGMGWDVTVTTELRMPAYSGTSALRYASLPDGTDPLRVTPSDVRVPPR